MAAAVPRLRHQLEPAGRHRAHRVDARQRRRHRRPRPAVRPIYGPALDGTLPGNEVIELSRQRSPGHLRPRDGPDAVPAGHLVALRLRRRRRRQGRRAERVRRDLAAARYLCSGGLNLRDQSQVMTAILRYNNSVAYAQNVLGWAAAYATGVVPVDLPPITGPTPPIADAHLDNYQGLGPGPADERARAAGQRPACPGSVGRHGPHRRGQPDADAQRAALARCRPRAGSTAPAPCCACATARRDAPGGLPTAR